MAIVRDYYSPEGCHILIDNSCYVNKTPEEKQAHIDTVSAIQIRESRRRYIEDQRKQLLKNKEVLA